MIRWYAHVYEARQNYPAKTAFVLMTKKKPPVMGHGMGDYL